MSNKTNIKDLFTIGEIAILFDINKKTLRYYDEIDLFKPSYIDEKITIDITQQISLKN